jgi:hypothetical protein
MRSRQLRNQSQPQIYRHKVVHSLFYLLLLLWTGNRFKTCSFGQFFNTRNPYSNPRGKSPAKLYHMLSFTFHDCIFFKHKVREREEEASKIIRDTRNLVAKKNKNVYARWIKDAFFLFSHGFLSDIWKLFMYTLGA